MEINEFTFFYEIKSDNEKSIIKSLTKKQLKVELAFHEASHFVFICLLSKYVNGFSEINHIISCVDKIHGFNHVNSFTPKLSVSVFRDEKEFLICEKEFFKKDKKRLVVCLMICIAGYCSYQVFIEDNQYFIGFIQNENTLDIQYYRIENAFDSNTEDFKFIKNKLRIYYEIENQEACTTVVKLLQNVKNTMKIPSVKNSIRFVKNILLKNQCKKIEGKELEKIEKKVKLFTNKIDLKGLLEGLSIEII
jgi:hypothetical protein